MQEHSIMVVPLLSGGGMRVKIIEAMALGQCVISTTIGAEGIEANHLKEIVLADTPEQLIKATIQLITNPQETELIGKNARKLAIEKYSWEKLVRDIEKFYIELI